MMTRRRSGRGCVAAVEVRRDPPQSPAIRVLLHLLVNLLLLARVPCGCWRAVAPPTGISSWGLRRGGALTFPRGMAATTRCSRRTDLRRALSTGRVRHPASRPGSTTTAGDHFFSSSSGGGRGRGVGEALLRRPDSPTAGRRCCSPYCIFARGTLLIMDRFSAFQGGRNATALSVMGN